MILTTLYLPVFVMLIGLILRGVAFEFRAKARDHHKPSVEPAVLHRVADDGAGAGLHAGHLHHGAGGQTRRPTPSRR
jgi:hypothetical protein